MISLLNVLKRTVSRILAKFRHGKWPSNSVKYKNNLLKQWRNISITQQLQKKARMAKSDEDWNRLQYAFFKNCWAEQFSNLGWLIMVFIIFQHLYFEESVLPLLITYCYSNGYFYHVIFMFYCYSSGYGMKQMPNHQWTGCDKCIEIFKIGISIFLLIFTGERRLEFWQQANGGTAAQNSTVQN